MTEIVGTAVAGSYAEHWCDPSTVENISSGGFFFKNQDDNTIDDLDIIMHGLLQYRHTIRSTAV